MSFLLQLHSCDDALPSQSADTMLWAADAASSEIDPALCSAHMCDMFFMILYLTECTFVAHTQVICALDLSVDTRYVISCKAVHFIALYNRLRQYIVNKAVERALAAL